MAETTAELRSAGERLERHGQAIGVASTALSLAS